MLLGMSPERLGFVDSEPQKRFSQFAQGHWQLEVIQLTGKRMELWVGPETYRWLTGIGFG